MENNPKRDILKTPQWSILIFGDGLVAEIHGSIEREDFSGENVVEFVIQPSTDLRKRYEIKESELNESGEIEKYLVKKDDLIFLNQFDDSNRKVLYIKNYLHHETQLSQRDFNLRKELEVERTKRVILEGNLIEISEQFKTMTSNPTEYLSQGLDFFNKISKSAIDLAAQKQERPNE